MTEFLAQHPVLLALFAACIIGLTAIVGLMMMYPPAKPSVKRGDLASPVDLDGVYATTKASNRAVEKRPVPNRDWRQR